MSSQQSSVPEMPETMYEEYATVPKPVPCVRCRYVLVTLDTTGACPECGTPIRQSLASDLLIFAPARALQIAARGLLVIACAMIGWPLGVIAVVLASEFLPFLYDIEAGPVVIFVLAPAIAAAGGWMLTRPIGVENGWHQRAARLGLVGGGVGMSVGVAMTALCGNDWGCAEVASFLTLICPLVAEAGLAIRLRGLAMRGRSRALQKASYIGLVLACLTGATAPVLWALDADQSTLAFIVFAVFVGAALVGTHIMALVLLIVGYRYLRKWRRRAAELEGEPLLPGGRRADVPSQG